MGGWRPWWCLVRIGLYRNNAPKSKCRVTPLLYPLRLEHPPSPSPSPLSQREREKSRPLPQVSAMALDLDQSTYNYCFFYRYIDIDGSPPLHRHSSPAKAARHKEPLFLRAASAGCPLLRLRPGDRRNLIHFSRVNPNPNPNPLTPSYILFCVTS